MRKCYFSGAVCLIQHKNEIIYERAFGYANKETEEMMTVNHLFDIASITKVFTSTIILKLIELNKLSLDMTIGETIQSLEDSELKNITILELLTHTSGLKAWYPFYSFYDSSDKFNHHITKVDGVMEEAGQVKYSDLNFMLLGEVIKNVTQLSLEENIIYYFRRNKMMEKVTYYPDLETDYIVATEYGNQIESKMCQERNIKFTEFRTTTKPIVGEVNDGNAYYYWKGEAGHAGLFAHAKDLIKLTNIYLNESDYDTFLSKEIKNKVMTERKESRFLGFEKTTMYPSGMGHTGFTGTAIWLDAEKDLSVTLLTNRLHVKEVRSINDIRKELFKTIYTII